MIVFVFVGRNRPKDEWTGVLASLGVPFCRFYDENNSWYQDGTWKQTIEDAVKKYGNPELSFGSSMGGWAALYHQPIIQARRVIAFTPQVTTIPYEMKAIGGKKNIKWAEGLASQNLAGTHLPKSDNRSTLYYSHNKKNPGQGDDGHRALALKLGYNVVDIDSTDHNLAGWLHDRNELLPILKQALDM